MKVIAWFKHLFIPHKKNDYKPHFFRELSVAIILFTSIFLLGASAGSSFFIHKTVEGVSIAASVLVDLTNESRLAYNEPPLVISPKLKEAAQLKGEDMANLGYFAHESPTGVTPWYWFKKVGYEFLYAGENLAINFTEANDVKNAWMNSPKHRDNLLNVKFREIGIATVEGVYNNVPTIFVVQMFGTPAKAQVEKIVEENPMNATSIESTETILAVGDVKGEAAKASTTLESVVETKELVVVKDTTATEMELSTMPPEKYSTWYDRLAFGGSRYVDIIYKILIIIVAIALITMILVEIKKQHTKHILYGVVMLLALVSFVFINRGFF
jgi:hypothetical protein